MQQQESRPIRSHYLPRTREGWISIVLFVFLFALSQPPVVHGFADRVEPRVLGLPFLYTYLLAVYVAMIAVLLWAKRKRI